ncbi:MAG: spore maturation protein [Clostridia bacterium]|nr:spore maturation protein [Clostridia bacterium]
MLGKIFGILCILSLAGGIALGNGEALGVAVLDGASSAVSLTISLCGIMSLWCGIMKVMEHAGLIDKLAKLLSPLLKVFFPDAYESGNGIGEISANISANLLGIGNAATPLALKAMEKLQKNNPYPDEASGDMITLAVLNTASLNLIPTTIIALRRAAGSDRPYSVIIPIWIASFSCSLLALILCSVMRHAKRKRQKSYD